MARSGSFPYVLLLAVIAFMLASFLYGVLDAVVQPITSQPSWTNGSEPALAGRQYMMDIWNWLLLPILTGIGASLLIAGRRGR